MTFYSQSFINDFADGFIQKAPQNLKDLQPFKDRIIGFPAVGDNEVLCFYSSEAHLSLIEASREVIVYFRFIAKPDDTEKVFSSFIETSYNYLKEGIPDYGRMNFEKVDFEMINAQFSDEAGNFSHIFAGFTLSSGGFC